MGLGSGLLWAAVRKTCRAVGCACRWSCPAAILFTACWLTDRGAPAGSRVLAVSGVRSSTTPRHPPNPFGSE